MAVFLRFTLVMRDASATVVAVCRAAIKRPAMTPAMTPEEIAAYNAGFDYNEAIGDYKSWEAGRSPRG